jgi:hypothetical protein
MKKNLFSVIIALASLAAYGQIPAFEWGAVLRSTDLTSTNPVNAAKSIRVNGDGDLFVCGAFPSNAHSTKGFTRITYNHYDAEGTFTQLASPDGAKVAASATNNCDNFFLYKLNQQGEVLWQVISDRGYAQVHYSQMVPTPDGGVFAALTVRISTGDEFEDHRFLRLVGSDGVKKDLKWSDDYMANTYKSNTLQGAAAKIDRDGKIEWVKHIMRVDDALIDGKSATIASYFDGIEIDPDGNYWLAGRYMKDVTFDLPGGGTRTLHPHFVEGWNGDSQLTRGDALLVKLNPQGELLWSLETAGDVDYISINSIRYDNSRLFIYGGLAAPVGSENASVTLLGHTISPSDRTNAFAACIDLSGDEPAAQWVTLFKSLKQTNGYGGRVKVTNINYDNGALFVCGSLTGFIKVNGETVLANDWAEGTSATALLGFIIRLDPATGDVIGKFLDPVGSLAAEIENVVFRQNRVYAFGYSLGSSWLHSYDGGLTEMMRVGTFLQSEGATAWDAVFLSDRIVSLSRGRNILPVDGTITGAPQNFINENPPAYSAFILSYRMEGLQGSQGSGLPEITTNGSATLKIASLPAALRLTGNVGVKIFSLAGVNVFNERVNGERTVALPTGVYVVVADGKAVKAVVKN